MFRALYRVVGGAGTVFGKRAVVGKYLIGVWTGHHDVVRNVRIHCTVGSSRIEMRRPSSISASASFVHHMN